MQGKTCHRGIQENESVDAPARAATATILTGLELACGIPFEDIEQNSETLSIINVSGQNSLKNYDETSDVKSPSARTITLRSNGSTTTPDGDDHNKEDNRQSTVADPSEEDKDEDQAAIRIQAAFRGHQTRKSMKQPASKVEASTASSAEPTQEQLEEEFRMDDKELCNAATKIQASFRGHMTRKQEAEKKTDSAPSQEKNAEDEEELDIDLADPDLNKAAVKIQASFRGHMSRKDNDGETTNN